MPAPPPAAPPDNPAAPAAPWADRYVVQPIVNLTDGAVQRYEVLARHARQSDQPSADERNTVAHLERTDAPAVTAVDVGAVDAAIALLSGPHGAAIPGLAVNLSAVSAGDAQFLPQISRRVSSLGAQRAKLSFELTETTPIGDMDRVQALIQTLRSHGHRVYLDDFGSGATSFPYLRRFAVDGVKIAGFYTRAMLRSPTDTAIIRAIAALCRELDLDCIAEEVETNQQRQLLHSLGVVSAQGYLWGEPAPFTAFAS